jgi:hypothetical protein
MDVFEAIESRIACRWFLDTPVDLNVVRNLIEGRHARRRTAICSLGTFAPQPAKCLRKSSAKQPLRLRRTIGAQWKPNIRLCRKTYANPCTLQTA